LDPYTDPDPDTNPDPGPDPAFLGSGFQDANKKFGFSSSMFFSFFGLLLTAGTVH
jgi:hypothetical protein